MHSHPEKLQGGGPFHVAMTGVNQIEDVSANNQRMMRRLSKQNIDKHESLTMPP